MPSGDDSRLRVLVAVVTWNSAAVLPRLLESMPNGLAGQHEVDIVVVDNASTDGTRGIARAGGVRVVNTGANLGYAGAVNRVYAEAQPDQHVLVLNPDARPEPGALAAMLGALDDSVGIVVPRLLDDHGRLQYSLRRRPTARRAWGEALLGGSRASRHESLGETIRDAQRYAAGADVEWASGAVMLVSAPCRARLGPWDTTFFLYSEETEYMLRAHSAGLAVRYVPESVFRHSGGDMERDPALWRLQVRNRIALHRRIASPTASIAFQAGVAANEILRSSSKVHRAGVGAALRPHRVVGGPLQGIVLFAGVDWWYHNRAHSDVQLALQAATDRPVLMVNSIGLRVPMPGRSTQPFRRIARKFSSIARLLRTPVDGLPGFHVFTPLALPVRTPTLRRAADRLVRAQVQAAANWLVLPKPHIVVTLPTAEPVAESIPRSSLTFNRSDLQSAFPEADTAAVRALEERLLDESDLVVYVSHALMEHDASRVGERGRFLDHGVDSDLFRRVEQSEVPHDLAMIPGPRVGFFGGLDDYVIDFDLLETLAHQLPNASLVLIGGATCSMERLEALPNVHWLGMRPYATMPAYGSGFDVALMPWLDNEWIRFCNPVKLKEYLCLGLPVVSTPFPEVDRYADVVRVATTHAEFVREVRAMLDEPGGVEEQGRRRARVASDTWAAKANELLVMLDAVVGVPEDRSGISTPDRDHDAAWFRPVGS